MKAVTTVSVIVMAAALLAVAGVAGAQGISDPEREFIRNAAAGGAAEVELGRLAAERAARPTVREFGAKMVRDHGAAGAELTTLAGAKGVELPTTLPPTHQAMRDRLAGLRGPEFDHAYMQAMVQDHLHDLAEFEKAAQSARDPDLRAWAGGKLPILREHLALARDVNSQVVLGPVPVVPAPAALPAAVVTPWCEGVYAPAGGTNFGACAPAK